MRNAIASAAAEDADLAVDSLDSCFWGFEGAGRSLYLGLKDGGGGDDSWFVRGVKEWKVVSVQAWPDLAPAVVLKMDEEVLASELAEPTPFSKSPGSCNGESLSV